MRVAITAYLSLCFLAAGCVSQDSIDLGQGYSICLKGSEPILHQSGTEELYHKEKGGQKLVAEYIIGSPVVLNGVAVFNAGLSDDPHWKGLPALLVYAEPGPACEITESVTKLYCTRTGKAYAKLSGAYCYRWPNITNDFIILTGQSKKYMTGEEQWINVTLTTNDVERIISTVSSSGLLKSYRKTKYRIGQ